MRRNPNGFPDRATSLYSSKIVDKKEISLYSSKTVDKKEISPYSSKTVDKKEILRPISNTGIYCSNDKVGTVYQV
jgi:hypothetical protein